MISLSLSLLLPSFIRNALRDTPCYITVELVKHSSDDQATQFLIVALHLNVLHSFAFIYKYGNKQNIDFLYPFWTCATSSAIYLYRCCKYCSLPFPQIPLDTSQHSDIAVRSESQSTSHYALHPFSVLWFHQFVMTIMTITLLLPTYCKTLHAKS